MIRDANGEDAGTICEIYNHYIDKTIISFEEDPVTTDEMQSRIASVHSSDLPWLVYENDGVIDGYAYATSWHKRAAYKNSVESSIYLRHTATGKGTGATLYIELLNRLKEKKYHVVIGGIALPNEASVALHEKLGFEKSAHYREIGYKFGNWVDVGYWQLFLEHFRKN